MNRLSVTRRLAELIVATDPLKEERVPAAARSGVLDWLSSVLAAREDSSADAIMSALDARGSIATASVLGKPQRIGTLDAALIHGYLCHALDYDDVHASVRGHPSAVILSALLALAEELHSTGAEFLAAYVIGVETMCRLSFALGSRHYEAGWHNTSTLGTLGAAAACARLMRLDAEKTIHALGLACTQSGGLRVHFGSQVKSLHAGFAARSGLLAVKLAAAGIAGAPEALDGSMGFLSIFSGGEAQPERVVEEWGQPWQIVDPGLWFKVYPCCSAAHHAADAALKIRSDHRPEPSNIVRITACFPPHGDAALVIREPKTGVEGRFSVEYVIAAALVDGELSLSTFDDKPIRQELRALAACVQRRYDATLAPAPNAMPKGRFTVVSVTLANGTTYIERVDCPRGAPGNPLSTEERLAKYHDAIQGLPAAWAELPGLVDRLENLTDLSQFIPNNV